MPHFPFNLQAFFLQRLRHGVIALLLTNVAEVIHHVGGYYVVTKLATECQALIKQRPGSDILTEQRGYNSQTPKRCPCALRTSQFPTDRQSLFVQPAR